MKSSLRKTFSVIMVIVISVVIFAFSAQTGEDSATTSEGLALSALRWTGQNESLLESFIQESIFIIRKFAHFIIFFLLGIASFNMFKQFHKKKDKSALYALLYCTCYAILDELHQYLVPGRSARVTDVVIDIAGATCGILMLFIISKRILKRKNEP
jgi:Predicted integral membrane protein